MKKPFLILFFLCCVFYGYSAHITGGEVIYDFISKTATSKTYRITLRLFRDENCFNCAEMPGNVFIGIYNNDNNQLYGGSAQYDGSILVNRNSLEVLPLNTVPQCISNPPSLTYTVGSYSFNIELPNNSRGYTAAYQTCCRVDGIRNVGNSVGATYSCDIPGTNILGNALTDNSVRFSKGISVVCFNRAFNLDFSATDPDGDQLSYRLCSAYNGGNATTAANITPGPPPYGAVAYINGFNGSNPLGLQATINSQTGIISGIAPNSGKYVVSVCVYASRNGLFIEQHRKDFIITVAPCDIPGAKLQSPNYTSCDNSNDPYTLSFQNLNVSPLNLTFDWNFGDPSTGGLNTSTALNPSHTYSDTGTFLLKLVVNKGSSCADSATAPVKIYPGFSPGFKSNAPVCKTTPVQFNDTSTHRFGTINSWQWDFGNEDASNDVSTLRNPTYLYPRAGDYIVTLIVGSDKGCTATIIDTITILDKPVLNVTNDTLICKVDTLRLIANAPAGGGSVTWSPNYNISSLTSFTPFVSPDTTTIYQVIYTDPYGCVNSKSIPVHVVDSVSLSLPADTTICRTDPVILRPNTDALYFVWLPAGTLNNPSIKNPVATPVNLFTTYYVTASISAKCFDKDSITVKTIPYPVPKAGADTAVCFGTDAYLHASGGAFYFWSPPAFLDAPTTPNPVSQFPTSTVDYVVTVRDTLGCPKPVKDTIRVNVNVIVADAGPRDTSVVLGQPLQLHATGSTNFLWTPVTQWLSNSNIFNPVSLPQDDIQYVVKVSNSIGCFDTDTINVKLYKLPPDLYVPTGFSPNGDTRNETLKPLALGLKSVDAFAVYNRWGQLLFYTKSIGVGWDGSFKGVPQAAGTYVWYADGTDYLNRKLHRKGSVVLIR